MEEKDILKRLDGIEHQLKFFADTYKHLHNIFIQGVHIKLEKSLLEPTLSTLNNRIYEFRQLFEELNKMVKEQSIIGTLAFMAKRLNEMEATLYKIKDEGIKKKVHLDFTIDGYEMVRRKPLDIETNTDNPDDVLKKLLNSLDTREAMVLTHRYGLLGEKNKTLDSVGKIIKVSRERARAKEIFCESK
jgi:DNA-directed RNA polymerase sigma subunit (sigma70/sigma32)